MSYLVKITHPNFNHPYFSDYFGKAIAILTLENTGELICLFESLSKGIHFTRYFIHSLPFMNEFINT